MNVVISKDFNKDSKRLYKKYSSLAKEIVDLIRSLQENPFQGVSIGRNCYKIRLKISSKNTGKSGGARVITHILIEKDTLTLLSIYDKSEQEDINDSEILKRLNNLTDK